MRILDLYWTLNEIPGSAAEQIDVELEKAVSD
jgi:hypothetical protein